MERIALLADLHLSDVENTPQEEALDWAVEELGRIAPDACVWLGDNTAAGSIEAAMRFSRKINTLPCPQVTVAGNSEIRTADTAPVLEAFFSNYPKGLFVGSLHIVSMNTSHDKIFPDERDRLCKLELGQNVLLCSHQPLRYLDEDSREFILNWIDGAQKSGHKIVCWASGHIHRQTLEEINGVPTLSVRALDLDKCIGGSAQICVMKIDGDTFELESVDYTRGLASEWSEAERLEFADLLGITCYNKSKIERDMPFAIKNHVKHIEWRRFDDGDFELVEKWRAAGGETLSLHYPSLGLDGDAIKNCDNFAKYTVDALRAGVDFITTHPPYVPNGIMFSRGHFEALADKTAELLLPVAEAGVDILVENNHTKPHTPDDTLLREYGCLPAEMVAWRDALNERLGRGVCHLRLDVGHARNNMPLSQPYPIGKWYSLIGAQSNSYHLHQTIYDKAEQKMKNHYPITGLHAGFVSFDGFLWAWRAGILKHGPIILEIREGEGAPATYERLRKYFLTGEGMD